MVYHEKEIERNYIFEGQIINVRVDKVEMPDGKIATREVVEHNGGVGVLPIDENNIITLVRQYRRPVGKDLLEIPAGKLAKGEDPLACGIRELKEETGLSAEKFEYLSGSLPSPGFASEVIHLYLATGLKEGEAELDEDEYLNVEHYHIDEAIEMAFKGDIIDGKTLTALFMTKSLLGKNE